VPGHPSTPDSRLAALVAPDQSIRRLSSQELEALQRDGTTVHSLLDLVWKISSNGNKWTGALRNDRTVVVTANNAAKLRQLLRYLTIAIMTAQHEPQ
jgi:hypothetical protein